MSFLEARFPERISVNMVGGPGYSTDIVAVRAGFESRNANWAQARAVYELSQGPRNQVDTDALVEFFRRVKGRAYGFRFKDWADFICTLAQGGLRGLHGTVQAGAWAQGYGVPSYQIQKRYGSGAYLEDRDLRKPVAGTVIVQRGGIPVTVGVAAGNIAIDTTTGVVTFVPDQTRAITAHTPGATHQVNVGTAYAPNFTVGQRIFLTGVTGTAAALLNNLSHAITAVSGSLVTIGTNTSGLTASGGSSARYPQASEALSASCEFDVPCRFDSDVARVQVVARNAGGLVYEWSGISIVEVRT